MRPLHHWPPCAWPRSCVYVLCPQAAREGWQCLLQSSQHPNLRPFVQLFLVQLLRRQAQLVKALLMPALQDYAQPSYQV